ncbi:hypothetical protein M758_11G148100 [Ceratodon purpureus]|nr:hypothetical protein M758_11G148100 [Ceratodon purpureus]
MLCNSFARHEMRSLSIRSRSNLAGRSFSRDYPCRQICQDFHPNRRVHCLIDGYYVATNDCGGCIIWRGLFIIQASISGNGNMCTLAMLREILQTLICICLPLEKEDKNITFVVVEVSS